MCRNIQDGGKSEWMGHNWLSGGIRDRPVRLMGGVGSDSTPVLGIFNTGISKMMARSFILKRKKRKRQIEVVTLAAGFNSSLITSVISPASFQRLNNNFTAGAPRGI